MLKIAFLDHHLNNYHADTFLTLLRGRLADEDAAVVAAWESDPSGEDWCEKNNVPRAASAEEAVRQADAVFILAPDNIAEHTRLAGIALPSGKPTFIDKQLATTRADAQNIVREASRYNAPLVSGSALRFASELNSVYPEIAGQQIQEAVARGMGRWDSYGVHTLSLAVALMGRRIERIIDTGTPTARTVTLDYGGGRRAQVDVRAASNEWDMFGWSFAARLAEERYIGATVTDFTGFYANLLHHVLEFCKLGKSDPESVEESLTIVAALETANQSLAQQGVWLPLNL